MMNGDTIVALATAQAVGALAIIRVSGPDAIALTNRVFRGKDLSLQPTHTAHLGVIEDNGAPIDEVVATLFREPKSFTRENSVEISCHGSPLIAQKIVQTLVRQGARLATPGEFTKRAFLNGRFDLAQAEAVADLIAADTEQGRQAALHQMRGGFSSEINRLREELIHFASLIELELDFSEEDVEFARRDELKNLIVNIRTVVQRLINSFEQGNVIKNGVPTVIAGRPNAGKSTLLNALLNEERAIVSDIPGTTRDVVEDEMILEGISFRFMDTAGLRDTTDRIEAIGVQRTRDNLKKASLILYVFDLTNTTLEEIREQEEEIKSLNIPYIKVGNKVDRADAKFIQSLSDDFVLISAATREHLTTLKEKIVQRFQFSQVKAGDVLVTNVRHVECLRQTYEALTRALEGMDQQTTGDFLAMDIRQALYYLGEITGQVTPDDLLDNIFSKFCIGK